MSRIDYSKWNDIEISDDEDDTHPNVDTASLFRWRHKARIERKHEQEEAQKKRQAEILLHERRINELKQKRQELLKDSGEVAQAQIQGIDKELADIQKAHDEYLKKEEELERKQREHPHWDVDNISHEVKSRSVINKSDKDKAKKQPVTEEEQVEDMTDWFKKNGPKVQKFASFTKPEQSHKYLQENISMVCEHMASYLVIYCVDLEVEGKEKEMLTACRQAITMQYILELAKTLKRDPRECVNAFFARLATAEGEYKEAFEDEVASLVKRVRQRAIDRQKEAEEKAKKERLGPGGLDPFEVLESLPPKIKDAFETQNTPLLQQAFAELPPDQAKYHYDRVVKSGLWVPAQGDAEGDADGEEEEVNGEEDAPQAAAK